LIVRVLFCFSYYYYHFKLFFLLFFTFQSSGEKSEEITPINDKELNFDIDNEDFVVKKSPDQKSGFWNYLSKLTGTKPLTHEDLEPTIAHFREHLESKNVALEIANELCSSVSSGLVGKKPGTFSSVSSLVRDSLSDALTRILTPKRNIDILLDIQNHKTTQKTTIGNPLPYVIIFMGVNGVGKSTNLAKVASWLKQSGHNPLLAACDTFRSGAVEQLKVHAKRLRIDIYEKGYGKDDTGVAQDAIKHGIPLCTSIFPPL
jgi:signal recognition particle receptor subunit alpha